ELDDFIQSVAAICDFVRAKKWLKKQIYLSFDEWNVWYQTSSDQEHTQDRAWQVAPPLFERPYTLEDALGVGLMLITLLRHADRVKIACMAQLVNTIAPISTVTGGGAWRQTIFYPFLHASRYGRGTVLNLQVRSPRYTNKQFDAVPLLDAVAVLDEEREELTIFAVNRGQEGILPLEGDLRGVAGYRVVEHLVLEHADPLATNTIERPDVVVPHSRGNAELTDGKLTAALSPLSWNVIRLARSPR
ncbi:MAG: alpha-N-arabinofuranosidase, partial [Chloroflexi bacterium]|nr:alpha-N-arabinofuranosidase [Chloroflexota bacterium]